MIRVFTSAAPNYLGKVRALFASLKHYHPEFALHLVLADLPPLPTDAASEGVASIITPVDLGLASPSWLFSHSTMELCTALKGRALEHLLAMEDTEAVLYFDPDIVLFSRLDDLVDSLRACSIQLTPHLIDPETEAGAILDNEVCALQHGVFNLGFLGVRNTDEGRRFAAWWSERLRLFCRADPESGLFTDQKWIDFVPSFFQDVAIVRDSRFNVAPWNIGQRDVQGDLETGLRVDGKPLGFYHFTGFDSGDHEVMLNKYRPESETLRRLTRWYRRHTAALAPPSAERWKLGTFSDGTPINALHRTLYRNRLDLVAAFPDPFAVNGHLSFNTWLRIQAPVEYPALKAELVDAATLELERQREIEARLAREQEQRAAEARREEAREREHRLDLRLCAARVRHEYEASTSWSLASPVRVVGRWLRRLGLQRERPTP